MSNNCGVDDWGLGVLLNAKRIRKMTSSYVGENKEFERQFLSGELELELTPQGTLAEKLRAGGSGIAAFFTADRRRHAGRRGRPAAPLRRRRRRRGRLADEGRPHVRGRGEPREYVLEEAIVTDFALVHALRGDRHGNLVFNKAARNFNPLAAMAGRVCIAQVEELVEPGELDPDGVHLPGIYVHRIVEVGTDIEKRIERRTVARPRRDQAGGLTWPSPATEMAARAARELARRLVRQPRHRPADAGAELRARRRHGRAAVRERHPRRRSLPDRGATSTPTSSTPARRPSRCSRAPRSSTRRRASA